MTDYVIISSFIKKMCKTIFRKELIIMIILKKRQLHRKDIILKKG